VKTHSLVHVTGCLLLKYTEHKGADTTHTAWGAFPVADTDLVRGLSYRYGVGRFMLIGICTLLHTCSGQDAGLQHVA
jgi:hypothetical protein